jgi:hypothetical protein
MNRNSDRVIIGMKDYLEAVLAEYGEDIKSSLHISEYGGGITPYVLSLNELIDTQLESHLNNL